MSVEVDTLDDSSLVKMDFTDELNKAQLDELLESLFVEAGDLSGIVGGNDKTAYATPVQEIINLDLILDEIGKISSEEDKPKSSSTHGEVKIEGTGSLFEPEFIQSGHETTIRTEDSEDRSTRILEDIDGEAEGVQTYSSIDPYMITPMIEERIAPQGVIIPSSISQIHFLEDANGDGYINKSEFNPAGINLSLDLSTDALSGDKIEIKITTVDESGNRIINTIERIVSDTDIAHAKMDFTINAPSNGTTDVEVVTHRGLDRSNPLTLRAITDNAEPIPPTLESVDGNDPSYPTNNEKPMISVLSPDGKPKLIDEHGNEIAVNLVDKGNGRYDLTPLDSIKGKTLKLVAGDESGNESNVVTINVIIDDTPPSSPSSIIFTEDANNDARLSAAENDTDSKLDSTLVAITLPSDAEIGDTLNVKFNSNSIITTRSVVLTNSHISDGQVLLEAPVVDNSTTTVFASVTDRAGNVGNEIHSTISINVTAPTSPVVVSVDGKTPGEKTNNPTPSIRVISPNGTPKLVDANNDEIPSNLVDNGGGTYTVTPINPLPEGGVINLVAVDSAGNSSTKISIQSGIDLTPTSSPSYIRFVEDSNGDGIINKIENESDGRNNRTTIEIGLPSDANIGDVVKVALASQTITKRIGANDLNNGKSLIEIPFSQGSQNISVSVVDRAGNESIASTTTLQADTINPSAPSIISIDGKNPSQPINNDTPVIRVISNGGTPSLVDNSGNSVPSTLSDKGGGIYELTPLNPIASGSVNVITTSLSGNTSSRTQLNFILDKTAPNAPLDLNLVEDANNDGFLNKTENESDGDPSSTKLEISLPNDVKIGDTLVLRVTENGVDSDREITIGATEVADKKLVVSLPTDEGNSKISAHIVDEAGNIGAKLETEISVDLTPPANPTIVSIGGKTPGEAINDNRPQIKVSASNGMPKLVDEHGNALASSSVDNGDGTYTLTPTAPLPDGGKIGVIVEDDAGNRSSIVLSDTGIDTTPPNAPTSINFVEDANNDGVLNKVENDADGATATTKAEIGLPSGSVAGDNIKVALVHNGSNSSNEITLTNSDITNGKITLDIPVSDGNETKISVSSIDRAGNESGLLTKTISAHIAIPTAPEIDSVGGKALNEPINDNKPEIKVTSPNGEPKLIDDNGDEISANIVDNGGGSYSITPLNALPDGAKIAVVVKDAYGNESARNFVNLAIDTTPPPSLSTSFSEDLNSNGIINNAENATDGKTDSTEVKVDITGLSVGDIVSVRVTRPALTPQEVIINKVVTAADVNNGYVNVDAPVSNGTNIVESWATDRAGNVSASISHSSINISIGPVTRPELLLVNGTAFNTPTNDETPTFRVRSPDGAPSLVDEHGNVIPSNVAHIGGNFWNITPNDSVVGLNLNLIATTPTGNVSAPKHISFVFDNVAPSAPNSISFVEDANNDGKLNATEARSDANFTRTKVEINLPSDAVVGDRVETETTINGGQANRATAFLSAQMISDGKISIWVPSYNGDEVKVSARIVDVAGNIGNSIEKTLVVKSEPPAPPSIDLIGGKTPGELININKPAILVTANGGTPKLVDEHGNDIASSVINIGGGKYALTPNSPLPDGGKIGVVVVDDVGNQSSIVSSNTGIDTIPPNAPTAIRFMEDINSNNDGKLNIVENSRDGDSSSIFLYITLPSGVQAGDTLVLQTTRNGITTTQNITLKASEASSMRAQATIPALEGDNLVSAHIVDRAGNVGGSISNSIRVDLTPPSAPIIDSIDGEMPGTPINNNRPAIKVTFTEGTPKLVNDLGYEIPSSLVDNGGGSYTLTPVSPLPDGGKIGVMSIDEAGNTSPVTRTNTGIDTTPPNAPTGVVFLEDSFKDGFINKKENALDGKENETTIDINIPNATNVGDILRVVSDINGNQTIKNITITTADVATGKVRIGGIPLSDNNATSVTAKIVDLAGNESASVTNSVTLKTQYAHLGQPLQVVTLVEDMNSDGKLNRAENNTDTDVNNTLVEVFLPPTTSFEVGDAIRFEITVGGNSHPATARRITQSEIVSRSVRLPVPVREGEDTVISVKAIDKIGNESEVVTKTIRSDFTAPSTTKFIKLLEDSSNNLRINKRESESDGDSANTAIEITLPDNVEAGDTLTLRMVRNGVTTERHLPIGAAEASSKKLTTTIPSEEGVTNISARVTDAAGNIGRFSSTKMDVKTTLPLSPVIDSVDGLPVGSAISNNKPVIKVTSPEGIPTLVDEHGTRVLASLLNESNGKYTFTVNTPLADGTKLGVIATDTHGNQSAPTLFNSGIDTVAPSAPTAIRFLEDVNGDGYINKSEGESDGDATKTKIEISLPSDAVAGDKLKLTKGVAGVLTSDEITLSSSDIASGKVVMTLDAQERQVTSIIANLVDAAGNTSPIANKAIISKSAAPQVSSISFLEDANSDGKLSPSENRTDSDENNTTIRVNISAAMAGDTLKLNANGVNRDINITAQNISDGYVDAIVPVGTTKTEIKAHILDKIGNEGAEEVSAELTTMSNGNLFSNRGPKVAPTIEIHDPLNESIDGIYKIGSNTMLKIGLVGRYDVGENLILRPYVTSGLGVATINVQQEDIDRGYILQPIQTQWLKPLPVNGWDVGNKLGQFEVSRVGALRSNKSFIFNENVDPVRTNIDDNYWSGGKVITKIGLYDTTGNEITDHQNIKGYVEREGLIHFNGDVLEVGDVIVWETTNVYDGTHYSDSTVVTSLDIANEFVRFDAFINNFSPIAGYGSPSRISIDVLTLSGTKRFTMTEGLYYQTPQEQASDGNDTIYVTNSNDRNYSSDNGHLLDALGGDDTIVFDYLGLSQQNKSLIDGGDGIDTAKIFTAMNPNISQTNPNLLSNMISNLRNIEILDFGRGANENTDFNGTLMKADVRDLIESFTSTRDYLTLVGDTNDRITLDSGITQSSESAAEAGYTRYSFEDSGKTYKIDIHDDIFVL